MGQKQCISRHNDDDRALTFLLIAQRWDKISDLFADGNSCDAKLVSSSVVSLHEDTYGMSPIFGIQNPRRSSSSRLEAVGPHSRATSHVALGYRPGCCRLQGLKNVLLSYMKAIDVVKKTVVGLCNQRQ